MPAVDVIVGPGNRYVAIAQRLVAGRGGGRAIGVRRALRRWSVIADETTPVDYAAIDLVVQAEHGPDGLAYLITWSERGRRRHRGGRGPPDRGLAPTRRDPVHPARGGYSVLVDGPEQAMAVANAIAAEHLELLNDDPESLVPLIRNAGAVFLGPWAPASVGDYVAGPNHVLPTARSARFGGALRVDDFRKHIHVVDVDRTALARLAPHVVALADSEGLPAHADSVRIRLEPGRHDGPARPPGGPRPAGGLPLPPGRRRGPAQHQRVAAAASARLASKRCTEELAPIAWNRYPDRAATALRAALADLHGVRSRPGLLRQRVQRGAAVVCAWPTAGRDGRWRCSSPPMPCTRTSPTSPGPRWSKASDAPDFSLDLDRGTRPARRGRNRPSPSSARPTIPTGLADDPATVRAVLAAAPGLVVVDEAYGQFADWSALTLDRRRRPHWW